MERWSEKEKFIYFCEILLNEVLLCRITLGVILTCAGTRMTTRKSGSVYGTDTNS